MCIKWLVCVVNMREMWQDVHLQFVYNSGVRYIRCGEGMCIANR